MPRAKRRLRAAHQRVRSKERTIASVSPNIDVLCGAILRIQGLSSTRGKQDGRASLFAKTMFQFRSVLAAKSKETGERQPVETFERLYSGHQEPSHLYEFPDRCFSAVSGALFHTPGFTSDLFAQTSKPLGTPPSSFGTPVFDFVMSRRLTDVS